MIWWISVVSLLVLSFSGDRLSVFNDCVPEVDAMALLSLDKFSSTEFDVCVSTEDVPLWEDVSSAALGSNGTTIATCKFEERSLHCDLYFVVFSMFNGEFGELERNSIH